MNSQRAYVRKTLSLSVPLHTATQVWRERRVFIIRYAEGGVEGWGEAAPLPGWGSESEAECIAQLDRWVETGVLPVTPSASFGVDTAILDHSSKSAAQPLWEFLGGVSGRVTCHETLGSMSLQDTITNLAEAVEAGFSTAKLKVGAAPLQSDVDRVIEVSRSFPQLRLRLDANGSWSLKQAQDFVEATRKANIDYLEQPLSVGDALGLVELRKLGVSVAADEGANSASMRTQLIDLAAVDVMVLKPSVLGSVVALREEVSRISEAGIRVVFSSAIESAIGRTAVAHMVAAVGTNETAGLNTGKWIEDDLAVWVVRNAQIVLEGPGLGVLMTDFSEQSSEV